jgi:osomolarity two-component system response regulator SSK1
LTAADVEHHRHSRAEANARPASPGRTLPLPPSGPTDGPLLCVFEIVHNIAQTPESLQTPRAEMNPFTTLDEQAERAKPRFDSLLCRRLLAHVNASLRVNTTPSSPHGATLRRAYELSVLVPRGQPIPEPPELSQEEEAIRQPFSNTKLGREPTLAELAAFADSLRGRRVDLHASLSSVFARHMTSYLAAWGMDISHHPIEEAETMPLMPEAPPAPVRHDSGYGGSNGTSPGETAPPLAKDAKFIIIDDDLAVLRRELLKIKIESPSFSLKPRLSRRPSLKTRARSSPQIRQIQSSNYVAPRVPHAYLIHFTSLANYNQVRDLITSLLATTSFPGSPSPPEVMVVPKPVGPRRFLTALHTAVNQPLVDPSFSPIATSPRSPGGGYFPGARTPAGSDLGREPNFFDTVTEEGSGDEVPTAKRSPINEMPPASRSDGLHLAIPTPGLPADVVATPAHEYFSGAAAKMGSAASGIVVQSPDGRPFGMFFEPPVRGEGRRSSYTARIPSDGSIRRRSGTGRASISRPVEAPVAGSSNPPSNSRRGSKTDEELRRLRVSPSESAQDRPPLNSMASGSHSTVSRSNSTRRKILPPGTPSQTIVAQGRERSSTLTQGSLPRPPKAKTPGTSPVLLQGLPVEAPPLVPETSAADTLSPKLIGKKRVEKPAKDSVVVPPINVLIVEGTFSQVWQR